MPDTNGANYRRIRFTPLTGEVAVSTVWMGIHHGKERTFLFQTMVLGCDDHPMHHWASEDEALAGHDRIVADLRAGGKM